MGAVLFTHSSSEIGNMTIENGLDVARWGYNLNTATYPTFGGEVVQILSVYIDDLTLGGSLTSYSQCEAVYSYFSRYMQIATQGNNLHPRVGQTAYNLEPIIFTYPERDWSFKIYPKSAPGFRLDVEIVMPIWQMVAHIIDDSDDLDPIKDAIGNQLVQQSQITRLNDQISPSSGNPETNPFQTYDEGAQQAQAAVSNAADYYNSLIPAYAQGDFSAITGGLGSTPATKLTDGLPGGVTVKVPKQRTKAPARAPINPQSGLRDGPGQGQ